MSDRCTCPTQFDASNQVVRAYTDQRCQVHGQRPAQTQRYHANCPSCTCRDPVSVLTRDDEAGSSASRNQESVT